VPVEHDEDFDRAVRGRHDAQRRSRLTGGAERLQRWVTAGLHEQLNGIEVVAQKVENARAFGPDHESHFGLLVDIVLAPNGPGRRDDVFEKIHPRFGVGVAGGGFADFRGVWAERDAGRARARPRHALPELFGDERHERVHQAERAFEDVRERLAGFGRGGGRLAAFSKLGRDELEVPVA
jgi:hypothetical protein